MGCAGSSTSKHTRAQVEPQTPTDYCPPPPKKGVARAGDGNINWKWLISFTAVYCIKMQREEACCVFCFDYTIPQLVWTKSGLHKGQVSWNVNQKQFQLHYSINWNKLISLMSSCSSDATQTRHFLYVLLCGRKGRGLISWRQSVYLWDFCHVLFGDVKVYIVSWHFRNCTCFYIWFMSFVWVRL